MRTMFPNPLPVRCLWGLSFHPLGGYLAVRTDANPARPRKADRLMKHSRLLALVTAATTVAALAACAAPDDSSSATTTDSGVKSSEATSADDFGGLDALVTAAQKEGELNVIALPPDWANYGEIISAFEDKYDIKINSDQPDGASQDEINAANDLKGSNKA